MKTKYKLPAIAATAVMASPIAVHATTIVDFSFTGSSGKTVTGSLSFASTNGTGLKPTDVKILTAPTPFQVPVDLGNGTLTNGPGYTFSNGNITKGSFYIQGKTSVEGYNFLSLNGSNKFGQTGTSASTSNSRGFSGVQYTTASTSVPEPASIALLGAGIAGIATFRRRRRTPRS